jgi:hypothetical protein
MADVKETKEVIDLGLTIAEIVHEAKKDGKIDLSDAALLMKLVPVAGPGIQGIGQVPAELADLSAEEAAELSAHVMAKLALDDPKARDIVEKALKAAAANWALVQAIQAAKAVAAPAEQPSA